MKHKAVFSMATAVTLVMAAGAAQAGFQWVPRPEAAKPVAVQAPVVEIMPAVDVEPAISFEAPVVEVVAPAAPAILDVAPAAPVVVPEEPRMADADLPPWLAQESPRLPESPAAQAVAGVAPPVVAVEAAAVNDPILEGFGKNMPLVIAMRQIVPADYQFAFGSGVNMGASITWEGGRPWKDVLSSVLQPMGLGMRIDGKIVYVEQMENGRPVEGVFAAAVKARVAQKDIPVQVEQPLVDVMPVAQPVVDIAPVAEVPDFGDVPVAEEVVALSFRPLPAPQEIREEVRPQPKWVIEAGRTLREVMEDWGRQAGWVVVWRSERDYLIESGASLAGAFEEVAEEVLQAFAHAEPPVKATFYRNKTLVIDAEAMSDLN